MINLPNQGEIVARNPVTELRLYSGVPWDNSYNHVRLYSSKSQLLSSLERWRVMPSGQLSSLAPIRVGDYDVRVPFTEMSALNINYCAYRNRGISNEWVFCFVTNVKWLSENTTRITLELDIFQNNFYDCTMRPCFVEYHHIPRSQDTIGGNLVPVNIETGDPVVSGFKSYLLQDWYLCLYATEGTTGADFEGKISNNVYRAASLWAEKISEEGTEQDANDLISAYNDAGKIDAIIAMFMAPELCYNSIKGDGSNEDDIHVYIDSNFFEGYTPKNKKLYSYPWCYVLADNNEGQTAIYKFELSDQSDHNLWFKIQGTLATLPQTICFPFYYKGNMLNYADGMVNSAFPQCAYSSDTFRAWIAQNKSSIGLSAMSSAMSILQGGASTALGIAAAPFTGGASLLGTASGMGTMNAGIKDAMSLIAEVSDKSRQPATAHGKTLSENINAAFNITGITFYTMTCKREFAQIADSFFETYGYPINRITTPNLNSRSTWNYVKTQNCGLSGKVDISQLAQLRAIFDRGVTLWHTDDVGNYGLLNN